MLSFFLWYFCLFDHILPSVIYPNFLRKKACWINGCCLSSSCIFVFRSYIIFCHISQFIEENCLIGLTVVVFLPLVFLFIRSYITFCHISQFFKKKRQFELTVVVFLPLVFLFIPSYIIFCHISQFF